MESSWNGEYGICIALNDLQCGGIVAEVLVEMVMRVQCAATRSCNHIAITSQSRRQWPALGPSNHIAIT